MKKALFVGVDEYQDAQIRNLSYAVRDARSLGWMFNKLGYETHVLEDPKQSELKNKLEEIIKDLKEGDQFLFYFSGHGFSDGGRNLLFCADDHYADLRHKCAGVPFSLIDERTRRGMYDRIFILDACRSDFLTGVKGGNAKTFGTIGEMISEQAHAGCGTVNPGAYYILLSCQQYEHAFEIDEKKHGLFTLALMRVLVRSRRNGTRLSFGDDLRIQITSEMNAIVTRGLRKPIFVQQTPESKSGGAFTQNLIDGAEVAVERIPYRPAFEITVMNAEPVSLYNCFIGLLNTKELNGFLQRFLELVPTDPKVFNPRMSNTPRIIENENRLIKLFGEIREAYIEKKRNAFECKFWSSEASRQNLSIALKNIGNRNRLLDAMYECIELL